MQTFYKPAFFVFVFIDKNLPAIDGITDGKPEQAFGAGKSPLFCHFKNLLCVIYTFGYFFKSPYQDYRIFAVWCYILPAAFIGFIYVANGR
nr:hypothetical protein [Taibaiella chishuiensis]